MGVNYSSSSNNQCSGVPRPKTHVANATGSPIRLYYNVDTIVQTELVKTVGEKMKFIPDSHIDFLRIPANSATWFAAEETMYISVFMEGSSDCDERVKTITENFKLCCDRSYIVAKDGSIRLQKPGEDIWMDEDGKMNL